MVKVAQSQKVDRYWEFRVIGSVCVMAHCGDEGLGQWLSNLFLGTLSIHCSAWVGGCWELSSDLTKVSFTCLLLIRVPNKLLYDESILLLRQKGLKNTG